MNGPARTVGQIIFFLSIILVREFPGEVFTEDAKVPKVMGLAKLAAASRASQPADWLAGRQERARRLVGWPVAQPARWSWLGGLPGQPGQSLAIFFMDFDEF